MSFLCGHGKKWLGAAAATHPKKLMEAGCKPSTIAPVGKQGSTDANQVLKKQSPSEVETARRAVRGRLGEATLPKPDLRPGSTNHYLSPLLPGRHSLIRLCLFGKKNYG
jgi:hypothetical protein